MMKRWTAAVFALASMVAAGLLAQETAPESTARNAPPAAALERPADGLVVDSGGRPVSGAEVELYELSAGLSPRREPVLKDKTISGSDGSFHLASVQPGMRLLARKAGYAPAWHAVGRPAGDTAGLRLVLTPPETLSGTVLDATGKPAGGVEVYVVSATLEFSNESGGITWMDMMSGKLARENFHARTGADGKFRINGFPTNALATLGVDSPGKVLRRKAPSPARPAVARYHAGQQDIELQLEPAAAIEGRVTGPDGNPLPDVRLTLESDRQTIGTRPDTVVSEAAGAFKFSAVPSGSYNVRAVFGTNNPPDLVAEAVPVSVQPGGVTRDVKITMTPGGLLEVEVVTKPRGEPVPDANVSIFTPRVRASAKTGTNGVASMRLPPGEYEVTVHRVNSPSQTASATVQAGATNRVRVEVSGPLKINGVVRDPSGAKAAGVRVFIFPSFGPGDQGVATTDQDGRFEVSAERQQFGPEDVPYRVVAQDAARKLAVAQEILENTTTCDLKLEPGLVIAGRVEDTEGKPLANAGGYIIAWAGNMGMQFGDRLFNAGTDGRFEIDTLPPGHKYSVTASAKGYGSSSRQADASELQTNRVDLQTFTLRKADQQLAGRVVDSGDKPVAKARVQIYGEGQPNENAETDQDGRFAFAVCEGRVSLFAFGGQLHGNTQVESGDTNVVLMVGDPGSSSRTPAPERATLKGKPLPDLAAFGLKAKAIPAGKPVLVCLLDVEQRPSRHLARLLGEQNRSLRKQGLTIIGLQIAAVTDAEFKRWQKDGNVPFAVGRISGDASAPGWATQPGTMPWLILADRDRQVIAEGFAFEELAAELQKVK